MSFKDVRREILCLLHARYNGLCQYCYGPTVVRRPEYRKYGADDTATIDHIIPISKGGKNHMRNVTLACRGCNEEKKDMEAAVFRRLLAWRLKNQRDRQASQASTNQAIPTGTDTQRRQGE